ncbi:hypothetical protein LIER_42393 [Lithospermum erythrorhizon]|uniref:Uncharacterized protein n=1 Tax=Lithospermum erythrorhizon TaxID=34254 RepID=A0AAV3RQR0_LITER
MQCTLQSLRRINDVKRASPKEAKSNFGCWSSRLELEDVVSSLSLVLLMTCLRPLMFIIVTQDGDGSFETPKQTRASRH